MVRVDAAIQGPQDALVQRQGPEQIRNLLRMLSELPFLTLTQRSSVFNSKHS